MSPTKPQRMEWREALAKIPKNGLGELKHRQCQECEDGHTLQPSWSISINGDVAAPGASFYIREGGDLIFYGSVGAPWAFIKEL